MDIFKRPYTVIYPVDDMDSGVAFFSRLFGFKPSYKGPSWSDFGLGNVRFGLREDIEKPCLVFYVESAEEAKEKLKGMGFEVGGIRDVMPFGREFEVKTPCGSSILIFQPMNKKVLDSEYFLGR